MNTVATNQVVSLRFEDLQRISAGGMGTVYRARDVQTDQWVAIKLLNAEQPDPSEMERFVREAELLAALHHPGIVRYVSHGSTADGQLFLAMEWLDGEDLATRLRRGPLPITDVVTLIQRVGSALEVAHLAGVLHRDLKPSNLFLRGGQCERVAIVDFGIARYAKVSQRMTRTGSIIGTPDYMAPEQARGEHDLGAAADIFSLGCVAYECLVGEPPFAAAHIAATLAKILFAEPEPPSHRRSAIPAPLETLIMSMLVKEPSMRLTSATEVLQKLSVIDEIPSRPADTADLSHSRMGLAADEQRLFCVIVVTPHQAIENIDTVMVCDDGRETEEMVGLRHHLAEYNAHIEALADGSLAVSIGQGNDEATEQVTRAVECAQLLRERYPDANVVLTTGRGVGRGGMPVGEAIDRAGQILREENGRTESSVTNAIILDEVSASLLRRRHRLEKRGNAFELRGESPTNDPSRPLLGQPTPCLGREAEFSILEGTLSGCLDEPMARAVLITGPAGIGKSRVCHEFLRRVGQRRLDLTVWMGSCDPLRAGTSYGPLSRTLRGLCNVRDSDSIDTKRNRFRQRIAQNLAPSAADQVVEFLGELCGIHFPDENSAKLRAARQDPRLKSDLVTQALVHFIEQECKRQPLLWVIEDLQWCDVSTIHAVGVTLRQLRDTPLLVIVSARDEFLKSFPNLWREFLQPLPLRPLGRKASERLVGQLLRDVMDAQALAHIVERADGNPLWLEELIRTAAEGNRNEPPRTIMAILQARIGQLPPKARQMLRAASVFGDTFWLEGIAALLRQEIDGEFEQLTQMLVDRELWMAVGTSRYAHGREMRFRHALTRDAAYELLTEEDRVLGHRLAGAFLEEQGESEAALLAEHAQLGGDTEKAVAHYSRAAEQSLADNDVTAALRHARAGLSCGPKDAALGLLQAIEAMVHHWGGRLQQARAAGLSALRLLPRGSRRWFQAMLAMWLTTTYLGEHDLFDSLRDDFAQVKPEPGTVHAYVEATSFLVVMTSLVGQASESRMFVERLLEETASVRAEDAAIRGSVTYAHGVFCHWLESDLWQKSQLAHESIAAAELIGDRRLRCLALTSLGLAQMGLGTYEEGVATFRQALHEVDQLHGENYLLGSTTGFFAQCLTDMDDHAFLDEAIALAQRGLEAISSTAPAAGIANISLAQAHMARADLEKALHYAEIGAKTLRVEPAVFPMAAAVLAEIQRVAGKLDAARETICESKIALKKIGPVITDISLLFQAAEFFHQIGDVVTAREDLLACARRLAENARRIPDPVVRRNYLQRVPLHQRIVDRLAQWFDQETAEKLFDNVSV